MNLKALIAHIPNSVKLAVLAVLATKLLVLMIGYTVTAINIGPASPLTVLEQMFLHWDSINYQTIAKNGYVPTGNDSVFIVFFPLFPLLIRMFTFDFAYINIIAIVVANVCSLIAFTYLYKLTKMEFNEGVAQKAVMFLSIFPLAYFLSAPYTEGLFFALVISCLYYARKSRWLLAGLLGFLSSLTRLQGLLMLLVLLVEYYHQSGWNPKKNRWTVLCVLLPLVGFLIYLGLNQTVMGSPFSFVGIQANHFTEHFDPWTGLNRAFDWTVHRSFPDNLTIGAVPLASAVFGLVMIGGAVWKQLRIAYITYMLLSWGVAVSVSWWISVPRYIFAMFPIFMLLGAYANKRWVNIIMGALSIAALCFFTVIFALGRWAF